MNISDYHWFAAGLSLAFALAAGALLSRARLLGELQELRLAARLLLRELPLPPKLRFRYGAVRSLWQTILALQNRSRSAECSRQAFEEVIALTSRLPSAASGLAQASSEVGKLLLAELSGEIAALAVIFETEEGRHSVLFSYGLPQKRLEQALLANFDELLNQRLDRSSFSWGYSVPPLTPLANFAHIGVGLSLSVPLRCAEKTKGAVWIGLKSRNIDPQRRGLISAIANHAAAIFSSAQKIEESEKKNDEERRFLLGLSHDIRSPGNAALCLIRELLQENYGAVSTEQRGALELMEQSIEDQLRIVGDVLDYAAERQGKLRAQIAAFSLKDVIDRVSRIYRKTAERKGLAFRIENCCAAAVNADRRQVQRILENLLSNAVKYTDGGEIRVSCSRSSEGCVRVTVNDTGVGIPAEQQDQLFQDFHRLESARGREGVGLGLSLARSLAELNGGKLSYAPGGEGHGSSFCLELPAAASAGNSFFIDRVLIVDDEPASARLAARLLKECCGETYTADNISEALSVARETNPGLLVSDLYLKDESAVTLLSRLKEAGLSIPTVILTGSALGHELFADAPEVKVVSKPAVRESLQSACSFVLSRAELEDNCAGLSSESPAKNRIGR